MTDTPQLAQALLPNTGSDDLLPTDALITDALDFVRSHLNMEVAYLSEFIGDDLVFRAVSAPGFEELCHVGGTMSLDQVYCRHILAGRLPELIPDTGAEPICQGLPLTQDIPIRSHVSVPIRRSDGSPYGMFCCLSRSVRSDLTPRDLNVMRAFSNVAADHLNDRISAQVTRAQIRQEVQDIIQDTAFDLAFQPIVDIKSGQPKGFEALCRFRSSPYRPPNLWFDDARQVDLQVDLELAVIENALTALAVLPQDIYLSVNASPDTVASGRLAPLLQPHPCERILLEVTEHSQILDYDELHSELLRLRFFGVRLAIDDAGAGYSGLQHIVRLQPDVIKLDMSLTRDICGDPVRRSLAGALVRFGAEIDAVIVAEGVETETELETLDRLGVQLAQGYFLGKPASLDTAVTWFDPGSTSDIPMSG
jgi:EAL domain-containing protein (putative c-di-GMP-specific phosphodiesterase class I)